MTTTNQPQRKETTDYTNKQIRKVGKTQMPYVFIITQIKKQEITRITNYTNKQINKLHE